MPKVSKAYMEGRRQQILDAAVACFGRKGIYRTSMDDICNEAGLSRGAIYTHFDSKEEIIAAAAERAATEGTETFAAVIAESSGPGDALDRLAQLYTTLLMEGQPPFILGRQAFETYAEEIDSPVVRRGPEKMRATYRRATTDLIRRAAELGDIRTDLPPESVATLLMALMEGLRVLCILYPDWIDASAVPAFALRAIGRECCQPSE